MRVRATDRAEESHWRCDWEPLTLSAGLLGDGESCLFPHVVGVGLDSDRVVDDAIHDRVIVNTGAEALVPVLLLILGAEHGRRFSVTAFHEPGANGPIFGRRGHNTEAQFGVPFFKSEVFRAQCVTLCKGDGWRYVLMSLLA